MTNGELKTLIDTANQNAQWMRDKGEISSARCWEGISMNASMLLRLRTKKKNPAQS